MKSIRIKDTFLWLLGLVTILLSSCSEAVDRLIEGNGGQQVTFSLSADGLEQKRATADGLRYVMAIYDETGTNKVVSETIFDRDTFSVRLDQGKYTCLFWADHGSANYDAADLTAVTAKANSADDANAEAFYAKQGITVTNGGVVNITLRRAVAQVILRETSELFTGTLTVSYTAYQNFNVGTGVASNEASVTKTFSVASNITGSVSSPAEVCSLFLLANSSENLLGDFKVKYEDDDEITISNVPIQANCKTNLNGKFGGIPYVTFSAASDQTFKMNFDPFGYGVFTLGTGEYFEYSVGGGSWTKFTSTVSGIHFGGTLGDLRLRGKSSKGTKDSGLSNISFGTPGITVDCKGDIRTLIDYENYETASTADARFCSLFYNNTQLKTAPDLPATTLAISCYESMFAGCTSLTTAPELPAPTLAFACYQYMFGNCTSLDKAPELPAAKLEEYCYNGMFDGCSKLSEVTMLATNISARFCVDDWLEGAGTEASSRTLTLASTELIYEVLEDYLPDNWKFDEATIKYK